MHGGIAQGVAQALLEAVRYSHDGQPKTTNFADYAVISAAELPSFELVHMETPTFAEPARRQGRRRVGHDRRDPGGLQRGHRRASPTSGVRHLETPLSPERSWRALSS